MTPEEFARQCAEMHAVWSVIHAVALGAMVLAFVLGGLAVSAADGADSKTNKGGCAIGIVALVLFFASAIVASAFAQERSKNTAGFIYQRDFAEQDYRAFLERMKYEPKGGDRP